MGAEGQPEHVPGGMQKTSHSRRSAGGGKPGTWLGGWSMAWFVIPATCFLVLLSLYPLFVLLQMGLSAVEPRNLLGGWDWVGLANYGPVLGSAQFWGSVWATACFTVFLLLVNLVVGFVAASLLAGGAQGSAVVQGLMIFVWAMPPVVIGNIWKFLFADDKVINQVLEMVGIPTVAWLSSSSLAVWSVAAVAAWASLPFSVVMMRAAMLNIPEEVYDAAAVDGASYLQTRLRIVLPMLRPTVFILAIFTVMYGFRSFDYVYVLTNGGPGTSSATLPYLAYRDAFTTFDFSRGSAVATISLLIVFALGLAYLRATQKELTQ